MENESLRKTTLFSVVVIKTTSGNADKFGNVAKVQGRALDDGIPASNDFQSSFLQRNPSRNFSDNEFFLNFSTVRHFESIEIAEVIENAFPFHRCLILLVILSIKTK